MAITAARDLGLHDLAIVGLAKERENVAGETLVDRVYLPGQKNGIQLRGQSSALFFLVRARDEAHRFANHARKKLGKGRRLRTALADIPGIGEKTRVALLRHLGSVEGVRTASVAALAAVPGVNKRHVLAIESWRGNAMSAAQGIEVDVIDVEGHLHGGKHDPLTRPAADGLPAGAPRENLDPPTVLRDEDVVLE